MRDEMNSPGGRGERVIRIADPFSLTMWRFVFCLFDETGIPLKIEVPFEDAARAFLKTPPPPTGTPGSRKVKRKARIGP